MFGFETLDKEFNKEYKPEPWELMWWAYWDKGISYEEFCNTPIPIILSIMSTNQYVEKEREKQYKKGKK